MKDKVFSRSFTVFCALLVFSTSITWSRPARAGADPFIAEIIMFGGNFAPRGWALCDGQLLAISSNPALFSILGTTYGGDGRTTFGLPDLRGRVPMHAGSGPSLSSRQLGQRSGVEIVTLVTNQIPSHNHTATTTSTLRATSANGTVNAPAGNILANDGNDRIYNDSVAPDVSLSTAAIESTTSVADTGGNQSHTNVQPFTVVNFIIALQGTFPSRN